MELLRWSAFELQLVAPGWTRDEARQPWWRSYHGRRQQLPSQNWGVPHLISGFIDRWTKQKCQSFCDEALHHQRHLISWRSLVASSWHKSAPQKGSPFQSFGKPTKKYFTGAKRREWPNDYEWSIASNDYSGWFPYSREIIDAFNCRGTAHGVAHWLSLSPNLTAFWCEKICKNLTTTWPLDMCRPMSHYQPSVTCQLQ